MEQTTNEGAHLPAEKLQFQVFGKHQMACWPAEKIQFQGYGNYSSSFMVNNLGRAKKRQQHLVIPVFEISSDVGIHFTQISNNEEE
jgi:hypothetical protein